MKICLLTENYYRGGLDTFIINLINGWPDKFDNFTIICNESHPGLIDIEKRVKKKVRFIKYNFFFSSALANGFSNFNLLKTFPFRAFFRVLNNLLEFPILYYFYINFFKNFFKRETFDLFISVNGGYPASLICRTSVISWSQINGNKSCYFLFHSRAMKLRKFLKLIDNYIDLKVYKSSNYMITVSKNCMKSLIDRNPNLFKNNLIYIHNGVSDNYETYKNLKMSNYFIMLSTYTSIKGYDSLIEIGKILKNKNIDFKIKVFGHGKRHEFLKIKKKISRHNLEKIIILNSFTEDPLYFLKKSIGLICLSNSQEAFGLTLIEAMSLGVPVLTTNVGGLKEVFKGSNAGYIYDKNNINGFISGIMELSNDRLKRQNFSINGRNHYLNHFNSIKMS